MTNLEYGKIRQNIVSFLKKELKSSRRSGYVVGLSGGLDSSVVTSLAFEAVNRKLLALILPSKVTPVQDIKDAVTLSKKLKVKYNIIDLEQVHSCLVLKMQKNRAASGNLLARLRMCMLYYYANQNDLLVLGTSDKSELLIGYFTKYGDGGADIMPIASLYKVQVKALGRYLHIQDSILTKKIGPILWKNHFAEDEIGMTYEQVDSILYCLHDLKQSPNRTSVKLGIPLKKVVKIKNMHDQSRHKRMGAKICKL